MAGWWLGDGLWHSLNHIKKILNPEIFKRFKGWCWNDCPCESSRLASCDRPGRRGRLSQFAVQFAAQIGWNPEKKTSASCFTAGTSTEHTWPTRGKSRRIVVAVGWLRGLTVVYRWPLKSQKSEQAWNSTKNTPVTRWYPRSYSSVYNPQWHYRYTDIYSNPHSSTLVFSPMVPLSAYSGIFRDNRMMASAHCAAHRSSPLMKNRGSSLQQLGFG